MSDHRRHHHHQEGQQQPQQQQQQQPSPSPVNSNSGGEDFKCNICLSIASDAVVTLCGHLFCWPCLYTWLHFHSRHKECPVCKGAASETKLIPIYSWGTKDATATLAPGSDLAIPPRPSAKRMESERQRRQRYHGNPDRRRESAPASVSASSALPNEMPNGFAPSRSSDYLHDISMLSRETRASWLERLRAMREERLAWPIAFVQGLTSRELVQQRRQQAREAALSSRFMVEDNTMHDSNDVLAGYCQQPRLSSQPGLQHRSLPVGCSDHILSPDSSSHTAQYLSTMSSILSSMEVFAKALELSSSSSLRRSVVAHPSVFRGPDEEQALWQSSMRALLAQMERLMVQLQSIQPRNTNDPALIGRWHLASNHRDGSMTERSHGNSRMERELMAHVEPRPGNGMGLSPCLGRFESNVNLARVAAASQCHRSVFSLPTAGTSTALEHSARGSKSRKRWDVTRMSR